MSEQTEDALTGLHMPRRAVQTANSTAAASNNTVDMASQYAELRCLPQRHRQDDEH